MTTINLNTQENCGLILFPDNQPHVSVPATLERGKYNIVCSLTDSNKLLQLCMAADALNQMGVREELHLTIPYLMGARFDRVMNEGDSFDLKVIAGIINTIDADSVDLYDVHSDVAFALINNAVLNSNEILVKEYDKKDAVLIIPDAGSAKKSPKYAQWNKNITAEVHCVKHRDTRTGEIELQVIDADKISNRNCVIIDDICDGGRTFIEIAKVLGPEYYGSMASLTLIVTHGIFSKGFSELEKYFTEIITSNTRFQTYNSNIVKVVNYEF